MQSLPWVRAPWVAWALGVVTLWPIVYMAGFLGFIASQVLTAGRSMPVGDSVMPRWFVALFLLHLLTMVVLLGLLVVYVVDVIQNQELPRGSDGRLLWLLLVILVGPFAQLVYWWIHVRPAGKPFQRRMAWVRSVRRGH